MDFTQVGPWLFALFSRRRSNLPAALATLLFSAVPLYAQGLTEYDVKAAYLFNFGKFLRQPEVSGRSSFDICLLGRDDIGAALEKLTANERNDGLPERTVRLPRAAAGRSCAIVFISNSEAERVDRELAELAGAPVLTVSDMPRFLEHGGMIQFDMQGKHVRFSVALNPVNRAGLSLSSELLKVALSVTGTPRREEQ